MHLGLGIHLPPIENNPILTTIQNILDTYNASMWLAGLAPVYQNYNSPLQGQIVMGGMGDVVGCVGDLNCNEGTNFALDSEFTAVPGSLVNLGGPTNGITTQYVGTGQDDNGKYVDIRIFGTATATAYPQVGFSSTPPGNTAAPQALISGSILVQKIAGDYGGGIPAVLCNYYTSGSSYVEQGSAAVDINSTDVQSIKVSDTAVLSTCALFGFVFQISLTIGQIIDVTMRLWKPQCNRGVLQGYFPTSNAKAPGTERRIAMHQITTAKKPTLRSAAVRYHSRQTDMANGTWSSSFAAYVETRYSACYGATRVIKADGGVGQHSLGRTATNALPDNTTCYHVAYVKLIEGVNPRFRIQSRNKAGTLCYADFDISTMSVVGTSNSSYQSIKVAKEGYIQAVMGFDSNTGASALASNFFTNQGASTANSDEWEIAAMTVMDDLRGIDYVNGFSASETVPMPVGPFFWQFDGVDDFLEGDSPFTSLTADHFLILATRLPAADPGSAKVMFCACNADANFRQCQLLFPAGAAGVKAGWVDDAGTEGSPTTVNAGRVRNEDVVVTLKSVSGTRTIQVRGNGGSPASNTNATVLAASVPAVANFGCNNPGAVPGANGTLGMGRIYGVIAGMGTPSGAELTAMEDFLAATAQFDLLP